jgi:hypothetical protein
VYEGAGDHVRQDEIERHKQETQQQGADCEGIHAQKPKVVDKGFERSQPREQGAKLQAAVGNVLDNATNRYRLSIEERGHHDKYDPG